MRSWVPALLSTALTAPALATESPPVQLEVVALSEDPVPGLEGGEVYAAFGLPVINASGGLAFTARLAAGVGGTTLEDDQIVVGPGHANRPRMLFREGDAAPGTDGTFESFSRHQLTSSGSVAFLASLRGSSSGPTGLWGPSARGDLELKALEGEIGPGADVPYTRFIRPGFAFGFALNDAGDVAFTNDGLVFGPDASVALTLLAGPGDSVPGAPPGVRFQSGGFPVLNDTGRLAFIAGFEPGGDVTAANDEGLLATSATGELQLVAREGDPAPGTTSDGLFGTLLPQPYINASGDVVFEAELALGPGGVTADDDETIWLADGTTGALELVVREGDPVPGGPPGALYSRIAPFSIVPLNDRGWVSFPAFLRIGPGGVTADTNQVLIAPDIDGSPSVAIQEGDPTLVAGQLFRNAAGTAINRHGDVLLRPSLTPSFPDAILLRSRAGEIVNVLADGDVLQLAPADARTVERVAFFGSPRGLPLGEKPLNDRRQIALLVDFTDGSEAILRASVPRREVGIEIDPGDPHNHLHFLRPRLIRVAILGADDFDVAEVTQTSLAFGPGEAPPLLRPGTRRRDLDRDGFPDLISST